MRVDRYMYIIIEVLTRINHDTYMSSPASASCANRTDQKGRKKEEKKRRLWTTNANRLQITVNLKKIHHLRRAFRRFCASSHPSYKCFMLENLAFFHNSSKTPDNADIANRKHYSAPAGALTLFLVSIPPSFEGYLFVDICWCWYFCAWLQFPPYKCMKGVCKRFQASQKCND